MTEPALDLFEDDDLDAPVAEAVRRVAIGGFHALWRGRSLTAAELAAGDATAAAAAADHLRARGRIEFSDDGRVVAVHGLARRTTRHRIEHNAGAVNTWCALDAIGIPAAMRIDAQAVTHCPTCGKQLTVTVLQGEPHPLPGAVLWYPEVRCGHLVDDFCSGANLFCSVDHLERWLGNNPTAGRVMSIDEAADLGRKTWREAADRVSIDREVIRFPLRIAAIMTTEPVGPLGRRPLGLGLAALLGCCAAHALIVGGVAATRSGCSVSRLS